MRARLGRLLGRLLWRLRGIRRLGSTWELPVVSIVLVAAAAGLFVALSDSTWAPAWWLAGLALALAGLYLGAKRFTGVTVAIAAALCVATGALALGHLGVVQIRQDRARDARAEATALQAQLDAAGRGTSKVTPHAARASIVVLCAAGRGTFPARDPRRCLVTSTSSARQAGARVDPASAPDLPTDDQRLLTRDRADAALAVGRFQLAVAGAADRVALQAQVTALEAADEAALSATLEPPPSVPIASAIAAGGDAVVSSLPGSSDVPLALEAAGWAVLALLGLLIIRLLSTRNASYALGPVAVDAPGGSTPSSPAETEAFRTFLLRNLPEPGAVPGGQTVTAMTDLAGAVALPGAGPIVGLIKAVAAAVNVPSGYTVEYRDLAVGGTRPVSPPAAPVAAPVAPVPAAPAHAEPADVAAPAPVAAPVAAEPGSKIAVRIRVAGSNRLLDQRVLDGTPRDVVIREGAYWAAARILQTSRSVPPWARWDAATYSALARYYVTADGGTGQLSSLRAAADQAPTSGLLALDLSQREAIEGDRADSFLHALQAATLYPRYLNARYRLAVSAALLAAQGQLSPPEDAPGHPVTPEQAAALRDAVGRYGQTTGHNYGPVRRLFDALGDPAVRAGGAGTGLVDALCRLAEAELDDARRLTWWPRVALNALRADERRFWWLLLVSWQRRKDRRLIAKSSRLAVAARHAPPRSKVRVARRVSAGLLRLRYRRAIDPSLAAHIGDAATPDDDQLRQLDRLGVFARAQHFERLASQLGQNWQLAYNLACFWSVVSERLGSRPGDLQDRSVQLLELAVQSRDSFQLTQSWAAVDPDLVPLAANPRFRALLDALPAEEAI